MHLDSSEAESIFLKEWNLTKYMLFCSLKLAGLRAGFQVWGPYSEKADMIMTTCIRAHQSL
jgi:hypothetical protein